MIAVGGAQTMRRWSVTLGRRASVAGVRVLWAVLAIALVHGTRAQDWEWVLPGQVPAPRVPDDNPMSEARFQLGRHLFYDKRLSGNATYACASCHLQSRAFADGRPVAIGSTGEHTPRNAPGLANVAWNATYTWANPALVTLERQMETPMFGVDPVEMGMSDANRSVILARLRADPQYPARFAAAFGDRGESLTMANVIKAIACFERGIVSLNSRYDQFLAGKATLSASEERGLRIFFGERGECYHCHGSFNFNDQVVHVRTREPEIAFHNTGLYNLDGKGAYPYPNRGVFETSGNPDDMGRFRAPSLRNVAVTAPYMHDGSVATLEDVINIYSAGGRRVRNGPFAGDGRINPNKDGLITALNLTRAEKRDLLQFLRTLTDEQLLTSERYSDPGARW